MQNVTGVGLGGPKDYSNWTFTYTQNYHLIDKGMNELTSKISCYDNSGDGNVTTKYYSINITGTDNPTIFIPSTGNSSTDNSTTGFHSVAYSTVLPQYSTIDTNNSNRLMRMLSITRNLWFMNLLVIFIIVIMIIVMTTVMTIVTTIDNHR